MWLIAIILMLIGFGVFLYVMRHETLPKWNDQDELVFRYIEHVFRSLKNLSAWNIVTMGFINNINNRVTKGFYGIISIISKAFR